MKQAQTKLIAQNKKAFHEYFIEEEIEAGIELFGTEVKSIRQGKVNLKECYCTVREGELFVLGMHISPYEQGNIFNKDPLRPRKLLLHKREIMRLLGQMKQQGFTLTLTRMYLKGQFVKVTVALVRGKKLFDKRDDAAKRDAKRSIERAVKEQGR